MRSPRSGVVRFPGAAGAKVGVTRLSPARPGRNPAHTTAARATGQMIAANGWRLVYGAGDVGLMGEVAQARFSALVQALKATPKITLQS